MGLMGRARNILGAKISRLLGMAEVPGEQLDYSYEQQKGLLLHVQRGIAEVATSKHRVKVELDRAQGDFSRLNEGARKALEAGKDDLAREALQRKAVVEANLADLQRQYDGLQGEQDQLVTNERALHSKVEAFGTQKEVIKAQYSAAEAQVRIGEAATSIGSEFAESTRAVQRTLDKVDAMKARASAVNELADSGAFAEIGSSDDPLFRDLAAIGMHTSVDDEMDALRKEIASGKETRTLTAGSAES